MVCAEARPRNLMVEEDLRTMSAVTMCPLIELNIPVKEILKKCWSHSIISPKHEGIASDLQG